MGNDLAALAKELQTAIEEKDRLVKAAKANSIAIEAAKGRLIGAMIDSDCSRLAVGDFQYSLQPKARYTKKSDADLDAAGIDFIAAIRGAGFGDLVRETVNPGTLQATIAACVKEDGEIPPPLQGAINVYEYTDVAVRREAHRK